MVSKKCIFLCLLSACRGGTNDFGTKENAMVTFLIPGKNGVLRLISMHSRKISTDRKFSENIIVKS
jgi:hypothetical protein